ncbi:MAG: glycosyltransferase family 4 protein [Nanoarchaeota archaeon]|nr:glycosyltransferase family 4 protein [Nanoarchaeota archaeon]
MKKKSILFVSENASALFGLKGHHLFGGAEVQSYYIANGLSKDFKVNFVIRNNSLPRQQKYNKLTLFKLKHPVPKGPFSVWISNIAHLFRIDYFRDVMDLFFFGAKKKPDVLLTRAPGSMAFKVYLTSRLLGKKFVYMVAHDTDCEKKHPLLKKKISQMTFNYAVRHADYIIAQSKKQARKLNSIGIRKVRVIRSGYPPANDKTIQRKDQILWVSRAEKWKRPELLVKLAKSMPEYQFLMICPGFNQYPDYGMDFVAEICNTPNIEFIDFVPFPKMDRFFQEAKIFINTSKYEGFPNTFVQAWKNGTPVVSTEVNPDGIITKERLGHVSPTIQSMKYHIKELMTDQDQYRRISKNCVQIYQQRFHINKTLEGHKKLYQELL